MELRPNDRAVKPSEIPLDRLAANSTLSKHQKLSEASRQFEAVFLRQILNESLKPTHTSNLLPQNASSEIYRDLMTEKLADSISKGGQFGVASVLEAQLQNQLEGVKPGSLAAPHHAGEIAPLAAGPRGHLKAKPSRPGPEPAPHRLP